MLAYALERSGLHVERQKPLDLTFEGGVIGSALKIDLLVESRLIIEVKSIERIAPVHAKQLLTYLRVAEQPLGLLMNFGAATFREGLRRVSNDYFGDWKANDTSS